jgi:hypothetical protein
MQLRKGKTLPLCTGAPTPFLNAPACDITLTGAARVQSRRQDSAIDLTLDTSDDEGQGDGPHGHREVEDLIAKCAVCQEPFEATHSFAPCRHYACCKDCAMLCALQMRKCPVCNIKLQKPYVFEGALGFRRACKAKPHLDAATKATRKKRVRRW